jgi:hypothetical protein
MQQTTWKQNQPSIVESICMIKLCNKIKQLYYISEIQDFPTYQIFFDGHLIMEQDHPSLMIFQVCCCFFQFLNDLVIDIF